MSSNTLQRATRRLTVLGAAACGLLVLAALLPSRAAEAARALQPEVGTAPLRPERPPLAQSLNSAEALRAALADPSGPAVIALEPGEYLGPFEIGAGRVVWGPPEAVVRSDGEGTTLRMSGVGSALLGVTVDGSGGRYDTMDAAVRVEADDCRVEGVLVRGAIFGIVTEQCTRVVVRGCCVVGTGGDTIGLRGDGIRAWETTDSIFEDNVITDSRDLVVWYSSRNRLARNHVTGGRYGSHLMYSHDCALIDNRYVGNVVGIFVMYSRGVNIERNLIGGGTGAAGIGIGLKESSDVTIRSNDLIRNTRGIYVDSTPFQPDSLLTVEANHLRLCQTAIAFHSAPRSGEFLGNQLRDNAIQVEVEGGGDCSGANFLGNDWDDYRGYDLDHDGYGDVPYESRSGVAQILGTRPEAAFLRGTAAFATFDAVTTALPLWQPELVLSDPRPAFRNTAAREEAL